jgi:peptidoglycan/LPS O-acetylase OafA/YrhL
MTNSPEVESAPIFARWRNVLDRPIPALDGIRGLAILSVLAHQLIIDRERSSHGLSLLFAPLQAGWVGVQLFFVLSGFLITGILLDTRDADNRWSSFFVRRSLRIFPPYYFVLALMFWVAPTVWRVPSDVLAEFSHQSWYWLYLANWTSASGAGIGALGHCWSLSVEEQFYLIWPPVVFMLKPRGLIGVCLIAAGAALTLRTVLVIADANPEFAYETTFARMDALTIGALTAILVRLHDPLIRVLPHLPRLTWLALVALSIVAFVSGCFSRVNAVTLTVGQSVLALGSACLILVAVADAVRGLGRTGAVLSWAPFRLFGKHSYAIYLFHLPLHTAIYRLFFLSKVGELSTACYLFVQTAYFAIGSALLLGIAIAFHWAIERPVLNLKRCFVVRRSRA